MTFLYQHPDCIALIHQHLLIDPDFLPSERAKLNKYLAKIDQHARFEKKYIDGQLAGFIAFYANDYQSKQAFITMLLVDEEYRRKNVAKQLLTRVLAVVKDQGFYQCSLAMRPHNFKALGLYQSFGFVETHRDTESIFMTHRF